VIGRFWKPCILQAVGGELDLTMLIGGAEERAAIEALAMMMMEAVSTSETSVYFYQTKRRTIPESCHLHTRRRENLTSQW
jgi:hypothetical protein